MLVIYIHFFFFIEIPNLNKTLFYELRSAQLVYAIFFLYLLLSGFQIKLGYSDNIVAESSGKKITPLENIKRKIFFSIPFLFELNTILDWTITTTSLDLYQWFKLEDAFITLQMTKYQM